jgi:hypothetical protein
MPILNKRLKEDKGKKTILHAVLFEKKKFTPKTAIEWLKIHNYNFIHNRETKFFYRFRIKEQVKGMNFYTIKLNNGVELIYMY